MVPQKHKISENCFMKNLETHFLWIEHGRRIQMSPRNHIFGIMNGRKGDFSVGHFIGCSVCHLHVLVGKRTVVPQKHKISQNCSLKNLKPHFLWIEHGRRIQMSPRNHISSMMAGRKGHFSIGQFIGC